MGQIKNIKLHIVTDIKKVFTKGLKMSAFRGARVLASLGQHGIRCNRLHQRRIVSLGLTSLCQVTMKKRALMDASVVPVNKYDLSTMSLTSSVSALFSADALAVTEDEDGLTVEDDDAAGKSKLSQCYSDINELEVHVEEHFLKYGVT